MFRNIWKISFVLVLVSCSENPQSGNDGHSVSSSQHNLVIYEIFVRDFSEQGDFQGVMDRLDSIQSLGINTIWLMPIHPIGYVKRKGTHGSPYSVMEYSSTHSDYGTPDQFKLLVQEAHARDVSVIIDWVANHTAWDHPWISLHPEWYTKDAYGNITHPPGTDWYDVADLNFSNTGMRLAMISAMQFWVLTANVAGFRFDAADFVPLDFWKQALDSLRATREGLILLAEGNNPNLFAAGFQISYGWEFYGALKDVFSGQIAGSIFAAHVNEYKNIPEGALKLRFTTNHDETSWDKTPIELFGGKDGAKAASVITTFMTGVPLLYNGQEVGSSVNLNLFEKIPINWDQNPDMVAFYKSLLHSYNRYETLREGGITEIANPDIVAFEKKMEEETFLVLVNVRNANRTFDIAASFPGSSWIEVFDKTELPSLSVQLPPYGFRVLRNNHE